MSSLYGVNDFFIEKFSSTGTKIWVKTYGGYNPSETEGITNLCFDSLTNSIYFNGEFTGSCSFDTTVLNCAGHTDAFIGRMDLNGNVLWAKRIGGSGADGSSGMAIDQNGNILLEVHLSDGAFLNGQFISEGEHIFKYDSNGVMQWHVQKFFAYPNSLGYEAMLFRIKIAGNRLYGIGMATMDTLYSDTTVAYLNFSMEQNILMCIDATNGTTIWMRPCGSHMPQFMNIAVDSAGNSLITGSFQDNAVFENVTLHTINYSEIFLAKYDSAGSLVFAKQTVSSIGANGGSIALNGEDGFYLAGGMSGSVLFDSISANSVASFDLFVARYDNSGQCLGVRNLGEADGASMVAIPNSDVYVAGRFFNTVTFGTNASMSSNGQSDIYIASMQAITGTQDLETKKDGSLIIYSNPNNGSCIVAIPEGLLHESRLMLSVYDKTGKIIQQKQINEAKDNIDLHLENKAKGIYQIVLSGNQSRYRGKVIIQ